MPTYEADYGTAIAATAHDAFAVLTDYERLPEWQRSVLRCQVLRTGTGGLPSEVRYEADVKVRRVTYVLLHTYEPPHRILSEYLEGDFRRFEGDWELSPRDGGGITARLWLRIDPGLPVPGPVARMLHQRVLRGAVEDLRRRLEDG